MDFTPLINGGHFAIFGQYYLRDGNFYTLKLHSNSSDRLSYRQQNAGNYTYQRMAFEDLKFDSYCIIFNFIK